MRILLYSSLDNGFISLDIINWRSLLSFELTIIDFDLIMFFNDETPIFPGLVYKDSLK
jgi:hypothetical protein